MRHANRGIVSVWWVLSFLIAFVSTTANSAEGDTVETAPANQFSPENAPQQADNDLHVPEEGEASATGDGSTMPTLGSDYEQTKDEHYQRTNDYTEGRITARDKWLDAQKAESEAHRKALTQEPDSTKRQELEQAHAEKLEQLKADYEQEIQQVKQQYCAATESELSFFSKNEQLFDSACEELKLIPEFECTHAKFAKRVLTRYSKWHQEKSGSIDINVNSRDLRLYKKIFGALNNYFLTPKEVMEKVVAPAMGDYAKCWRTHQIKLDEHKRKRLEGRDCKNAAVYSKSKNLLSRGYERRACGRDGQPPKSKIKPKPGQGQIS